MRNTFTTFVNETAEIAGSYWAALLVVAIVVICGVAGLAFHSYRFSRILLHGIVILTFLPIIIQLTHKRNTKALYRKLDELSFVIR